MNKEYLNTLLEENKEKFINEGLDIIEIEDLELLIRELVTGPLEKEFDIYVDFDKLFNIKQKEKVEDIENVLY